MTSRASLHPFWIIAGVLLVAGTLRGTFTGAGPLLGDIGQAFDLGASQAGFLITLPLLAFFVVSPFAARLARAAGLERAIFLALIAMIGGVAIRSAGPLWALYLGSTVLGAGIAIGNTLLPSLLKRDFPDQITKLTTLYAVTMGVASAGASAVMVPLAQAFDWRWALAALIVLPLTAALVWAPQLRRRSTPGAEATTGLSGASVWRSGLAWQVTLFFGVNSFVYYAVAAWLPSILTGAGMSPEVAGGLHGVMQLATAAPGLVLVPLVRRMKDQRALATGFALLGLMSLAGLYAAPGLAMIWVALFGFAIGGAFILALAFIGLRSRSAEQTAQLSGMTQSVGYLMSACGPIAIGALHDAVDAWAPALAACGALCILLVVLGLGAGRDRQVA